MNRVIPFGNARSLSSDEVYAVTAYLLYLNDQVDEDFELSCENFSSIQLPNEENFSIDNRNEEPKFNVEGEPCMTNCIENISLQAGDSASSAEVEEILQLEADLDMANTCQGNVQVATTLTETTSRQYLFAEKALIVKGLLEYRDGTRDNTTMEGVAGNLSNEEIAAIAAYLASVN